MLIRRMLAFIVDMMIAVAGFIFISLLLINFLSPDAISRFFTFANAYILVFSYGIIYSLYMLFKDALFEGKSAGKIIFGLKVVDMRNLPCSPLRSFQRNFLLVIFPVFIIIELFVILLRHDRRRIGDLIAGTWVKQG